jgi:hypothetical protein
MPPYSLLRSIKSGTRIFGNRRARVLHFSKRAINLLFNDKVITLLNRHGVLSPSTIIVDVNAFPHIEWAEFFENTLKTDKFEVEIDNFVDLSIHERSEINRSQIMHILKPFLTVKLHSISKALLRFYGLSCELKGFEKIVSDRELEVLSNNRTLEDLVENLLGLGFGLTPSGDDFVLGIISVLNLLDRNTDHLRSIIDLYDNPFSKTILVNALDSHYPQPLYALLKSMINNSLCKEKILNLLNVGHTSGYDTLAGIYYALDIISH